MAQSPEIVWKRYGKGYDSCVWQLWVDGNRMGRVEGYGGFSRIYLRGKQQDQTFNSISGGRLRLEQLVGVESEWAKDRRARMVYLTPEEITWKILTR